MVTDGIMIKSCKVGDYLHIYNFSNFALLRTEIVRLEQFVKYHIAETLADWLPTKYYTLFTIFQLLCIVLYSGQPERFVTTKV